MRVVHRSVRLAHDVEVWHLSGANMPAALRKGWLPEGRGFDDERERHAAIDAVDAVEVKLRTLREELVAERGAQVEALVAGEKRSRPAGGTLITEAEDRSRAGRRRRRERRGLRLRPVVEGQRQRSGDHVGAGRRRPAPAPARPRAASPPAGHAGRVADWQKGHRRADHRDSDRQSRLAADVPYSSG
jgi:hypothetical protein